MIDVLVWNKYTRVVMQLAERLNISPEKALHLFYNSKVYALLLNKQYPLITLSDAYITDEIILELQHSNNPVVALNSVFQEFIPLYIQSTFQPLLSVLFRQ